MLTPVDGVGDRVDGGDAAAGLACDANRVAVPPLPFHWVGSKSGSKPSSALLPAVEGLEYGSAGCEATKSSLLGLRVTPSAEVGGGPNGLSPNGEDGCDGLAVVLP